MRELVTGFFASRDGVARAIKELRISGIDDDRINVLTPGSIDELPEDRMKEEADRQQTGETVGTVLGGLLGGVGGVGVGAAAASMAIPGIGPIIGIGLVAGSLLGMISGAKVGRKLDDAGTVEMSNEDLASLNNALHRGGTVVIVSAIDEHEAETAREVFAQLGTACAAPTHKRQVSSGG